MTGQPRSDGRGPGRPRRRGPFVRLAAVRSRPGADGHGPLLHRLAPCNAGFTLAEVLVAVAIMGVVLLAAASLFAYAIRETATGSDLGSVGAVAVDRMELLRANDFYALAAGGSLGSSVAGFSDASDPRFTVRWQIVDNAAPSTMKTISVRAIAVRRSTG